jgi:hypothetical protein
LSRARYEIRAFQPGDEERVLAFHNRTFAGHAARSRAHFDWRYPKNPAGPPELVLALDGERCVAVYAVLPVRCVLEGAPVLAGLQTDMAVDPSLRGGLGGSRLIVAVGAAYQRTFLNGSKPLEWGFPEPDLQRVCLAHLKVGVLRDVCFLVLRADRSPAASAEVAVTRVERFTESADELWRRCASELGTATVRDARYLNWRYAEHPDVRYELLEARRAGALAGLAVLREGGPDARLLTLMDWLVPRDERAAERALLAEACAEARERSLPYLGAWVPLAHPLAWRWQEDHGFLAKGTPFQECYRSWGPGLRRRWLDEHWFQTMGDIDFF